METMRIFKTALELYKFTLDNNLTIVDRKGYLVKFKNWKEVIATFDEEYFVK